MKGAFIVFTLLLFSLTTEAYQSYGLWCIGRVTLENGEVIEGEINYDLRFEVVQVRDNGIIRAFTAEGIMQFTMFDPVSYLQRDFISLNHQLESGYERKALFEIIADGEITVLRKSEYIRRPRIMESRRASHVYLNTVCKHHYYAIKSDEILEINDFKAEILPWMNQYEQEVNNYIKKGKVRLRSIKEQLQVVGFYNQLYANHKLKGTRAGLYYQVN